MLGPQFTRTNLRNDINDQLKGDISTTEQDRLINRAVRDVINDEDIDLHTTKKMVSLSLSGDNFIKNESIDGPDGSDLRTNIKNDADKYYWHCPADLKALIDVRKRYDKVDEFELSTAEQALRRKSSFGQQIAIDEQGFMRRLIVSGIEKLDQADVHNCDTYDGDGTWTADGSQITAVATETDNYVCGTGAVGFTTVSGALAGGTLTNSNMDAVDLSGYTSHNLYIWVYIPMATGITSFTLKWGSSASAYYSKTVTATHDNTAFYVGWNLLKFSWPGATETGTVDDENIDYLQLTLIKGATNTGTTGWIMDRIIAVQDSEHAVVYYTRYGWQTTAGIYLEDSTADTDKLNVEANGYKLILHRALEYCSEFIDDDKGEAKHMQKYTDKKEQYMSLYPSERKLMTTIYQGIQSTDEDYFVSDVDDTSS